MIVQTEGAFSRYVDFSPAFDKRDPNPLKDYGIHGVGLRFVYRGPKGAAHLAVYTNWHLPHVTAEQDSRPVDRQFPHLLCRPIPADLGYHSPTPRYTGQDAIDCDVLPGGKCYSDGSVLNATPVFEKLLREGDHGVWAALADYYREVFDSETWDENGEVVRCFPFPKTEGQA